MLVRKLITGVDMSAYTLCSEGDVDLLNSDVHDPHAVAGLLKSFLRELPSSLLTRDLHMQFLAVMGKCSMAFSSSFRR